MPAEATATSSTQGTPVHTSTSLTTTTVVPAPNPLMEPKSWMELGAFILMLFAVYALIEKRTEKRRREDADFHKLAHDALNKEIVDIHHDLKGNKQEINAVAANRTADVERIVKLEIGQQNIREGQARIEANMEKNHRETLDTMKSWIDQVSESVREVRDVKPRT
jgi:hypothetical protein